jgi:4-carboxymuconolactone decarboxylase
MKMRKAVLGASYVDNSMANAATDDFMMSFQDITTQVLLGLCLHGRASPRRRAQC